MASSSAPTSRSSGEDRRPSATFLSVDPGGHEPAIADLVGSAATALKSGLVRNPERSASGPHEVEEFGPALRETLIAVLSESGVPGEVRLDHDVPIADWSRPRTQADLVVLGGGSELSLAAELKVWDVGHQLFDVAKVCCLLEAGAKAGFLLCIGKTPDAFDSSPGGELFRPEAGLVHGDVFPVLFQRHPAEARRHLRRGRPCPTSLPRRFSTTAICDPVPLDAYPNHELRAAQVRIEDPTPTSIPPELFRDE